MEIIENAKRDNMNFEQKFEAATEFLQSDSLNSVMAALEDQYVRNNEGQSEGESLLLSKIKLMLSKVQSNKLTLTDKEKKMSAAQIQKMLEDQTKKNISMISADFIRSSGVNKNLSEVYNQLQESRKGPPLIPQQMDFKETAFEEFEQEITEKFNDMQYVSGLKVLGRLKSKPEKTDREIQCSEQ